MKMEVSGKLELEKRLEEARQRSAKQQLLLKDQLDHTVENLKPSQLIRGIFNRDGSGRNRSEDGGGLNIPGLLFSALPAALPIAKNLFGSRNSTAKVSAASTNNLLSTGLDLLSTFTKKSVSGPASKGVINQSTRSNIYITLATLGVGFIAKRLFKAKPGHIGKTAFNSVGKTIFTTLLLANIDKIVAWVQAAITTDLGKKHPSEV